MTIVSVMKMFTLHDTLVEVGVEDPAVHHVSGLVLHHGPELGLDAGVAQSHGAIQVFRVGVRLYLENKVLNCKRKLEE